MAVLPFFRVQCEGDDCGLWMSTSRKGTTRTVGYPYVATEFESIPKAREAAEKAGWSVHDEMVCPACVKERESG